MGSVENHLHFPSARTSDTLKNGMNIQDAIRSGKPFRRRGWPDDGIFVVYVEHDIVLTLEKDFSASVQLDVQDILAEDWYTREDAGVESRDKYTRFWEVR
jgi:hypothetical protein